MKNSGRHMTTYPVKFIHRHFWLGTFTLMLAGCASGPDFKSPATPGVTTYTATPLPAQTASSAGTLGAAQHFMPGAMTSATWWQQFNSPKLDMLIQQALVGSPTLAAAQATLRQAEQNFEAQAGASLYPQANLKLGAQRQAINAAPQGKTGGNNIFNLYNTTLAVSYNFDLSGANRRALEALAAQTDYQRFQLDGVRLTLAANITITAITQAQLAAQIETSNTIIAAGTEQLHITGERMRLGAASELEMSTLQTQLEQTRATLPPLRNRWQQTGHLLAILAGQPPGSAGMPQFTLADFTLPTNLPVSVPSTLVRQRPDIQAAEALLHAANAKHGEAIAKQYPQISLSANLGSQALTTATLFGSSSAVWGLAGQLTQPLFNLGLRAEARAAEAGFNAAAANYRQTVLQALRSVADSLRALDNDALTLTAQAAATESAQNSLRLVEQQYKFGAASYIQLLTAQTQAQQTQTSLISAQSQRLSDTVVLYQTMGMGADTINPPKQAHAPVAY
jgi:NodT family efflux transporter outer membrane factor (OMF) lipoprotein